MYKHYLWDINSDRVKNHSVTNNELIDDLLGKEVPYVL